MAALQKGGAITVRLKCGCRHYVLLTGADESGIYMFDLYFRKNPFNSKDIEIIADMPHSMNRKVSYDVIDSFGKHICIRTKGNARGNYYLLLYNTANSRNRV